MKVSNTFSEIIKTYVENKSNVDMQLKEALLNPLKNIEDCTTYILNTVFKSGLNGFADEEIFDLAIEYYTTENIDVGAKIKSQVIINRIPEISPEEVQLAKEKAFNELVNEEKLKLSKKQNQTKKSNQIISTPSLF